MFAQKNNGILNLIAALFPTGKNPFPIKKISENLAGFPISVRFREVFSRIQRDSTHPVPSGSPQSQPLIQISPGLRQVIAQFSEQVSELPGAQSSEATFPLPELVVVVQQSNQTIPYQFTQMVRQSPVHNKMTKAAGKSLQFAGQTESRAQHSFSPALPTNLPQPEQENVIFPTAQAFAVSGSPIPLGQSSSPAPQASTSPEKTGHSVEQSGPPASVTLQFTTPTGESVQLIFTAVTEPFARKSSVLRNGGHTASDGKEPMSPTGSLFVQVDWAQKAFQETLPDAPQPTRDFRTGESEGVNSTPGSANHPLPGIPIFRKTFPVHNPKISGNTQSMSPVLQGTGSQPVFDTGTISGKSRSATVPFLRQPTSSATGQEVGSQIPIPQSPNAGESVRPASPVPAVFGESSQSTLLFGKFPQPGNPGFPVEFPPAQTTAGENLNTPSPKYPFRQVRSASGAMTTPIPSEEQPISTESAGETTPLLSRSAQPSHREPIHLARSVFDLFTRAQTENRSGTPVFKTPAPTAEEVNHFNRFTPQSTPPNASESLRSAFTTMNSSTSEETGGAISSETIGKHASPASSQNFTQSGQMGSFVPAPSTGSRIVFNRVPSEPERGPQANTGKRTHLPLTTRNFYPGRGLTDTFQQSLPLQTGGETTSLAEGEPALAPNNPVQEASLQGRKPFASGPNQLQVFIFTAQEWEKMTSAPRKSGNTPQQPNPLFTRSQSVSPVQNQAEKPIQNHWRRTDAASTFFQHSVQTERVPEASFITPEAYLTGNFTGEAVSSSAALQEEAIPLRIPSADPRQPAPEAVEAGQPEGEKTPATPSRRPNHPANQTSASKSPLAEGFAQKEGLPKYTRSHTISGGVHTEMSTTPTSPEAPNRRTERSPYREPTAEPGKAAQEPISPVRKEKETTPLPGSSVSPSHAPVHRQAHRVAAKAPHPTSGHGLTQPMETISRIARAFRLALNRHGQEILMELKPEALGLVKIQLKMQEEKLTGKVEVTSPEVHRLVAQHLPELTQRLQEMHIKVEQVEVQVMNQQAENQTHQQTGQNRGSHPLAHSRPVSAEQTENSDQKMPDKLKFHYSTFEYVA